MAKPKIIGYVEDSKLEIGNVEELQTTNKDNLVKAINEVHTESSRISEDKLIGKAKLSIDRMLIADDIKKGRIFTDFTDFVLWYGIVKQDATHVITGKTSLMLTPDASNTTVAGRLRSTKINLANTNMMIRMYIEDINDFSNFEIRFSSVDNMASYLGYKITKWRLIDGWNEFMIPLDKLTIVGTGTTLETINTIQVSVTGVTKSVWVDAMYLGRTKKPSVMLHFDDAFTSQYANALPIMRAYGLVGSVGVISDYVGTGGHMTLDQLKRMYDMGWDMFNHTKTHVDLTTVTTEQVAEELLACKQFLINNNLTGAENLVAYPYGSHNANVINIMNDYEMGRITREDYEVSPSIQPHRLKCINMYPTVDIATAKAHIDYIVKNNCTAILLFHKIEPSTNTEQMNYPMDAFEELVRYISDRNRENKLDVLTWSEYNKSL